LIAVKILSGKIEERQAEKKVIEKAKGKSQETGPNFCLLSFCFCSSVSRKDEFF
jgi:hypothetical protein